MGGGIFIIACLACPAAASGRHPRLAIERFGSCGAGAPEDSRIAATRATKSPITRFARSDSSRSRTVPFGSAAHMVLMQSRVRDNEATTANIGSIDGGAASGSDAASRLRATKLNYFLHHSISKSD